MKKIAALLTCLLCCTSIARPFDLNDLFAEADDDFFADLFDDFDDDPFMDEEAPSASIHSPAPQPSQPPTPQKASEIVPVARNIDDAFLKALPEDVKKVPALYARALRTKLTTLSEKLHALNAHLASFELGAELHRELADERKAVSTVANKTEQLMAQKVYHLALYHKDFNSLRRRIAHSFDEIDTVIDAFVDLNVPDTLEPLSGSVLRAQKRVARTAQETVARTITPLIDDIQKVFTHNRGTNRIKEKKVKYEAREQAAQKQGSDARHSAVWGNSYNPGSHYSGGATQNYAAYNPFSGGGGGAPYYDSFDWGGGGSYNPWDMDYGQSFGSSNGSSYYAPYAPPAQYGSPETPHSEAIGHKPPSSPVMLGGQAEDNNERSRFISKGRAAHKALVKHDAAYQQHKTDAARERLLTRLLTDEDVTEDLATLAHVLKLSHEAVITQTTPDSPVQKLRTQLSEALVNAAPFLIDCALYTPLEQSPEADSDAALTTNQVHQSRAELMKILGRTRNDDDSTLYDAFHAQLISRTTTMLSELERITAPKENAFLSADDTAAALRASMQLHQQPSLAFYTKDPEQKEVAELIRRKNTLNKTLPPLIESHLTACQTALNDAKEEEQAELKTQLEQLEGMSMIWRNEKQEVATSEKPEPPKRLNDITAAADAESKNESKIEKPKVEPDTKPLNDLVISSSATPLSNDAPHESQVGT